MPGQCRFEASNVHRQSRLREPLGHHPAENTRWCIWEVRLTIRTGTFARDDKNASAATQYCIVNEMPQIGMRLLPCHAMQIEAGFDVLRASL